MRSPGDRWGTRHRRNRTRYKYGNSSHHMLPIVSQRCTHTCHVPFGTNARMPCTQIRTSIATRCLMFDGRGVLMRAPHAQRTATHSDVWPLASAQPVRKSQVQQNLSVPVQRRAPRCIRTCSHPIVTCTWVQWHVGIGAQLDAQHLAHGYVCFGSVLAPSAHDVDHTTTAGCIRANGTQHHSPSLVPSIFAPDTASGRIGASTYRRRTCPILGMLRGHGACEFGCT